MPLETRKVFVSWSKPPTGELASSLCDLLRHMFDNVEPWVSRDNVEYGTLSIGEIHQQLAGTSFGILVVTRLNQAEPWLNYEAGALAKTIPDEAGARVVPLLIDHERESELTGPMGNLQSVLASELGVKQLMRQLSLTLHAHREAFDARWAGAWPPFEAALAKAREAIAEGPEAPEPRTEKDMLAEMLAILRRAPTPTGSGVSLKKTPLQAASRRELRRIREIAAGYGIQVLDVSLRSGSNSIASVYADISSATSDEALAFQLTMSAEFPEVFCELV